MRALFRCGLEDASGGAKVVRSAALGHPVDAAEQSGAHWLLNDVIQSGARSLFETFTE